MDPGSSKSVDLEGNRNGAISQDIETIAGKHYFVTFMVAGNPDGGPATKTFTVTAPDVTQNLTFQTTMGAATHQDMGWVKKDFTFTATGASSPVTFTGTTGSSYGAVIDAVVVTQIASGGEDCKKDGWMFVTDSIGASFKNQGDCVSFHATGEKNLANPRDDA